MKELIRFATVDDWKDILTIYSYYVEKTVISFEYTVPTEEDFKGRIETISKKYPYLVYCIDDKVVGYAYASKYAERAAYLYSVDFSVYIDKDYRGKGIAGKLYCSLIKILKEQGYVNGYSLIEGSNTPSIKFHEKIGFKQCGYFEKVGYKFKKWHDLVELSINLNEHSENPGEIILPDNLSKEFLRNALAIKEKQEV